MNIALYMEIAHIVPYEGYDRVKDEQAVSQHSGTLSTGVQSSLPFWIMWHVLVRRPLVINCEAVHTHDQTA